MTTMVNYQDLLQARGIVVYTKRYDNIDDLTGLDLQFPVRVREFKLHYEGSNVIAVRTGNVAGSEPSYVTSDGYTETFPIVCAENTTIMHIAALNGDSVINLSVTAWS